MTDYTENRENIPADPGDAKTKPAPEENYFLPVLKLLAPGGPWPIQLSDTAIGTLNTCSMSILHRTRALVVQQEAGAHHATVVTPGYIRAGVARPDLAPFELRELPRMMGLAADAGRRGDALFAAAGEAVDTPHGAALRYATTAGLMWLMARDGVGFDDAADKRFYRLVDRARATAAWCRAKRRCATMTTEEIIALLAEARPDGWISLDTTPLEMVGGWSTLKHLYEHTRPDGGRDEVAVVEWPTRTPDITLTRHHSRAGGDDVTEQWLSVGSLCDFMVQQFTISD